MAPAPQYSYNIPFVNSERWLAKSRVDITQCQHGKVGKFLSLCFFVLHYKTNIKHFFRIDILYSYINTRGNWENSKLCENTPPFGRRVSTQITVYQHDITVYQHGKCYIFANCKPFRQVSYEINFRKEMFQRLSKTYVTMATAILQMLNTSRRSNFFKLHAYVLSRTGRGVAWWISDRLQLWQTAILYTSFLSSIHRRVSGPLLSHYLYLCWSVILGYRIFI
jgi:hypothetical protein